MMTSNESTSYFFHIILFLVFVYALSRTISSTMNTVYVCYATKFEGRVRMVYALCRYMHIFMSISANVEQILHALVFSGRTASLILNNSVSLASRKMFVLIQVSEYHRVLGKYEFRWLVILIRLECRERR